MKIQTHGKTGTHAAGMGFDRPRYGYRYNGKYLWVTHAIHYQCYINQERVM